MSSRIRNGSEAQEAPGCYCTEVLLRASDAAQRPALSSLALCTGEPFQRPGYSVTGAALARSVALESSARLLRPQGASCSAVEQARAASGQTGEQVAVGCMVWGPREPSVALLWLLGRVLCCHWSAAG